MRVLRSFRVLRVMKMFKYLESLKMIAAVRGSCMRRFSTPAGCVAVGRQGALVHGVRCEISKHMRASLHVSVGPQLGAVQWPIKIVLDGARVMCTPAVLLLSKPVLQVLISSMASFASIVVLLVLFWMVFSIVGLHVFGGLTLDIPWPNHDSLINSMINSFHVRCQLGCQVVGWDKEGGWVARSTTTVCCCPCCPLRADPEP